MASLPNPAAWTPATNALIRLAGLPKHALEPFALHEAPTILAALIAAEAELVTLAEHLGDTLYEAISTAEGELRGQLIALRRTIFKLRLPKRREREPLRHPDLRPLRSEVLAFCRHLAATERRRRTLRATFEAELTTIRTRLQALVAEPAFQRGVQISSPDLALNIPRFLRADPAHLRSRDRQIERGLYPYAMRMAAKTSPLGWLGPVAAAVVDPAAPAPFATPAEPPRRAGRALLQAGALARIAVGLSLRPQLWARLHVELAPDAEMVAQGLRFLPPLTLHAAGTPRTIKLAPPVQALLAVFAAEPRPTCAGLVEGATSWLAARSSQDWAVVQPLIERTIAQLLQAGLLRTELYQVDTSGDHLALMADRLRETPEGAALAQLCDDLAAFASADPATRQHLSATIRAQATELAQPFALDTGAALIAEDSFWHGDPATIGAPLAAIIAAELADFAECLHRRDGGGLSRAWLADVYDACGPEPPTTLAALGDASTAILAANQLRLPETMRRTIAAYARIEAYNQALLDAAVQAQGHERVIEPEVWAALIERFPAQSRPEAAAFHLQFAPDPDAPGGWLAVLNYTLPGYARFLSRYAAAPNGLDAAPLDEAVALASEQHPGAVITPLLATLNYLPHVQPPTSGRVLPLPGEPQVAGLEQEAPSLCLALTKATKELALQNAEGEQVVPLILSALHLNTLPATQRTWTQFAAGGYHPEFWRPNDFRRYARTKPPAEPLHLPRLRLGRLIIQRETWIYASDQCPAASADDCALWEAWWRWSQEQSLPAAVFARVERQNGSAAKPLRIAWDDPLSVRMLAHELEGSGAVIFEEIWPAPDGALAWDGHMIEAHIELYRKETP